MATNLEIKIVQRSTLYDLLKLKKDTEATGADATRIFESINRLEASMEQEDVAWVEKKISELP